MVLFAKGDGTFLMGKDPVKQWLITDPSQFAPAWSEARILARDQGFMMAAAVSYESAHIWNSEIPKPSSLPQVLGWWGIYTSLEEIDWQSLKTLFPCQTMVLPPAPRWTLSRYIEEFNHVKAYLEQGQTYQLNLTFFQDLPILCPGGKVDQTATLGLFLNLVQGGQGDLASYFDIGNQALISLSPEIFFQKEGDIVTCRPMKGTASRIKDPALDQEAKEALKNSEKNRAENLMITDMIRNDLGRIAITGTVQTTDLFKIETYPTVFQMTSTVKARTNEDITAVMKALFPCASITGAPKIRSMEKLAALEDGPRGWYTGALGWISPKDDGRFTVAIRTLEADLRTGLAKLGTGGGVVWDSQGESEYRECLLKARFLTAAFRNFDLTEALLWTPEKGYFLRERHLNRIERAAKDFGGSFSRGLAVSLLDQAVYGRKVSQKVRLSLGPDFTLSVQTEDLRDLPEVLTAAAAPGPLGPHTLIYRRYKTSDRRVYSLKIPGVDQVIFYNEKGELTESTSMNIVLSLDGEKLTPALSSGLLGGTFREELIESGEVKERVLSLPDLYRAEKIWLVNSVRKWKEAKLMDPLKNPGQ